MQFDIELPQAAQGEPPAALSGFVSSMLVHCLGIRAVWWSAGAAELPPRRDRLVIFADTPTLAILRKSDCLHRADLQALVVFDGDRFHDAWGPDRTAGSLARWAWRQDEPDVAYYSEAKWPHGNRAAGIVVRIRRKAL